MKKRLIKILGILMIAVMAFAITACGGSSDKETTAAGETVAEEASRSTDVETETAQAGNPAMVGNYKLTEMVNEGETINAEDIAAMEQMGMYAMLVVKNDGTAILNLFGLEMDFKYDDKCFIDESIDKNLEYVFDNDTITIQQDKEHMSFKRMTQEEVEAAEAANKEYGDMLDSITNSVE